MIISLVTSVKDFKLEFAEKTDYEERDEKN